MASSPPSVRPDWTRSGLTLLLAAIAGAAGGAVGWLAVRDAIARKAEVGFGSGREWSVVWLAALIAGGLVFALARRLLRGPLDTRQSFLLSLPRVAPVAVDYRTAAAPSLNDLLDRLGSRGYRLEATMVAETGEGRGPASPATALVGISVLLRDARLGPACSGLLLRVSERAGGDAGGLGIVEALDSGRRRNNEELALFVIAELADLIPGITYKRGDSALSAEPASLVRSMLPARPRAL